jgi:thioester reductase-like protein
MTHSHTHAPCREETSVLAFYTAHPYTEDRTTVPDAPGFEDVSFRLEKKPVHQLTKAVEDTDTHTLKASICVAHHNQAGFNLAILETQPNGKSLMLSQECKYSQNKGNPDLKQTFEDLWQQEVQKWRSSPKRMWGSVRLFFPCVVVRGLTRLHFFSSRVQKR